MSVELRRAAKDDARLIVRVGGTRYAIPAAKVREIVRLPRVTRVPLGPPVLLGLCNVRGETLAILDPNNGRHEAIGVHRQLLVLEGPDRIGLAVDAVEQMERGSERSSSAGPIKRPLDNWITEVFPVRDAAKRVGVRLRQGIAETQDERITLLRFSLAGQSFALPLDPVAEVVAVPKAFAALPGADAAVHGTMLWRQRTIGLLSLSVLLGLCEATKSHSRQQRIIVVTIGGHLVGLLVDRLEGLLRIAPDRIDLVPQMLQQGISEARIEAICRPEDGGLVSVLAAGHLLSEARTRQLLVRSELAEKITVQSGTFPVLLLAVCEHRLALPLAMVEQVTHVPEQLTAVPAAPTWLVGVIQRDGAAVAIIDQGLRLTGNSCNGARRRLVMVKASGQRVGFLVDDARNILHVDQAALEAVPLPEGLAAGIYGEALGVGEHGDTLLLLDPAAMISSAEQDFIRVLANSGSVGAA